MFLQTQDIRNNELLFSRVNFLFLRKRSENHAAHELFLGIYNIFHYSKLHRLSENDVEELKTTNTCRSKAVKPATSPYQHKRHSKTQNKLRLLHLFQTLNENFHVHFHLSYLYTDTYCILSTLVK